MSSLSSSLSSQYPHLDDSDETTLDVMSDDEHKLVCGEGAADEDIVWLLPPNDNTKDSSHVPRTPRKGISKVDPTAKSNPPADEMTDVDKVVPEIAGTPNKLIEGTLVIVMVSLATYVIKDQGVPQFLTKRLRILDRGDGEAWDPAVPTIPEHQFYSPMNSPQRRGRDDAADTASNNFGFKSSPSPTKKKSKA
ncbi:hypothetical protein FB451DRAFT_1164836 [Mycena latifolia]|nr:hypothetical protein FB451DRAFT_1164836 [Mycena latifolia]